MRGRIGVVELHRLFKCVASAPMIALLEPFGPGHHQAVVSVSLGGLAMNSDRQTGQENAYYEHDAHGTKLNHYTSPDEQTIYMRLFVK
jgi:hypothetical protein